MPANTDFNVSPYWDDFNIDNDFYRVLFRPGFAVQARELTQLQTILQNQIEQFGNHFFKDGTIVIPGSVAYDNNYYAVKLQSTFGTPTPVSVATYIEQYAAGTHNSVEYTEGAILTGATSGVTAQVVRTEAATTAGDPDTIWVKYIGTNTTDNTTMTFSDNEEISADRPISSYAADVASAQLLISGATVTGSAASVTSGIFFINGFMCRNSAETIVLDKYTNTPSYRIGFTVTETLVTPEADTTLLDNAQGSSNFAAKGAHRFKITLTLAKKALTATDDTNFVELARVNDGNIVHRKKATEYAVVADMLARRTDDESGDYIVRHFDIEARENLNTGTNRGIYTAAQGGVETKDTLVIAPGKAYVNGYEVETQTASFVDFDKSRTTKRIQNDTVPFNLGNYANVDNVYGQPDISLVSTAIDPFDFVRLQDQQTITRGSPAGAYIGTARSRSFEYKSGTVGAATAVYHHYLFDITMFTLINLSANCTITANAVITGLTSGATGIAHVAITAAADIALMQIEGAFQVGEALSSSVAGDTFGAGVIQTITTRDFASDVKQIYMDSAVDYTADIVLNQTLILSGDVSVGGGGTALNGTNTKFTTELQVGDVIQVPSGAAGINEEFRITVITNNLLATFATTGGGPPVATNAITSTKCNRIRGKIAEEEETVLVYKTPKDNTQTLLQSGSSDTSYTFRKQFTGTTNASSEVSFTANAGEAFYSASAGRDYTLTITTSGGAGGNLPVGAILDISSTKAGTTTVTGTGTQSLTVTDATLLGTSAQVILMATITVGSKAQKAKTANKMSTKTIASNSTTGTASNVFGERVGDKNISLSYADVYTLHAIYESTAIGVVPVAPTLQLSNATGTFTVGEIITGTSTGATGRVILHSPLTTMSYVMLTGTFTTNDQISGGTSGYMATVTATAPGSRNVTSGFLLDTGQRDSFYDLGRVFRKGDSVVPTGQLLIVYDYFSHGTGDYFDVDSYTGQVDYADIPEYRSTKVDPESKAPIGFYELRDALDWRPRVEDQIAPTSCPFSFHNKNFEQTGASAGNLPVPDDNVTITFDFYLGRLDLLYLDKLGNFIHVPGIPGEDPRYPASENINMLVARFSVAPFTFKPETDIIIQYEYNRRYTMGDIGKLESRVQNLEYATALGLLERETDSFQVLDENGLDRFKSGFLVDSFYGHNLGNTLLDDYQCAMDPGRGHMRPKSKQHNITLIEENASDTQRTSNNYQKTGDIITLPYTHTPDTTQPYASRAESVNPFSVTLWAGNMTLTPDSDFWMDEERVPAITIDVEGNYEQMLREVGGNADLGTIWDSWNTTWSGNLRTTTQDWLANRGGPWRQNMRTTTTSVDQRQRRTGTNTRLVERVDQVSMGDRVVSIDVVPWMRTRDINFTVTGMKPNTRVYAFFDKVDVNADTKPVQTSASNTTLTSGVTKTATTITVASTTGFPTTGTLGVGDTTVTDSFGQTFRQQEQMTYTGLTATTFTGLTRNTGNQFIEPQEHASGVAVTNQTYGTQMVSDNVGTLYGRFKIPNTDSKRFRVGTRTFRLTDSSTNSMIQGIVETSAEKPYTASGFVQTKREEIMNVRNAELSNSSVTGERIQTNVVVSQQDTALTGVWYDPLAQTVMCDQNKGMFITKLDVFFQAKDDTLPVWCEVRSVVNGYPSNEILPFSKISLTPADVNIDATTATTATTFTFESPIYIRYQQEFCVVLASNSPKYKVWIARIGDVEIGGTRTISTQPTLGSLFKSQNASTWTPSQYEDLKFTLYRAVFDISNTGTMAVVNEEMTAGSDLLIPPRLGGGKEAGIPTLPENPIDTSITSAYVRVKFKDHGMYSATNSVTISGVTSEVPPSALNGALGQGVTGNINVDDSSNWPTNGYVKIDDELIAYVGKPNATSITITTRAYTQAAASDVAHEDNSIVELYMIGVNTTTAPYGIPLTEINKTHASPALYGTIGVDDFMIATTTAAAATVTSGGTGVQCTRNISTDVIQPIIQTMELPGTTLTGALQSTSGTSVNGTQTSFNRTTAANAISVPINEDHYFDAPQIVCSQINETAQLSGNKSLRLTMSLTSDSALVSPVIDTGRMGAILIGNKMNQINSASDTGVLTPYLPMTAAAGDPSASIYMTKKVTLTQGATALQVLFGAVNMSQSNIKVLYKTLRADSAENFDDIDWVFFNTDGSPDATVPISKTRYDYKEYKYFVGKNSVGVGTELPEFVSFAIKIVLQGTNSALPPMVKDFRAIAFQA